MSLTVALLLALQTAAASVAGEVRDATAGTPLAGVRVVLADLDRSAETDGSGRYTFRDVAPGPQHLTVEVFGYASRTLHALVPASGTVEIDILLRPEPIPLDPLDVRLPLAVRSVERRPDEAADRVVTASGIRSHPLLAEPDVLLGITGGSILASPEAPAGLHIRGGAADQTMYELDGIPVFSPYHVSGLFGGFNPDAVARVRVAAAAPSPALPAALAGVVVVETRDPAEHLRGAGALTTSHVRAAVEGTLGPASFLASWRSGFANRFAPTGEASYPQTETGDVLVRLTVPVLAGRLALLAYDAENEVEVAADAPDDRGPASSRNAFGWQSRSVGARWSREVRGGTVDVRAWQAGLRASASWDPLGTSLDLSARREDRGILASVSTASGWLLGTRVERIGTVYRVRAAGAEGTSSVPMDVSNVIPAATLFGSRRLALGDVGVEVGAALAWAANGTHFGPRAQVRWAVAPRVTLEAAVSRSHQYAQSLRNGESVTGSIFPADLYVGAGEAGVPVARGDQGVLGIRWAPLANLRVGASAWARRVDGVLVPGTGEGDPFVVDSIGAASGTAQGASIEATLAGARYAVVVDYGWQRVRLGGAAELTPSYAPVHSIDAGVRLFPTPTSSVRLALSGAFGRHATDVHGSFEWESCNLLDRGCEFGGTPRLVENGTAALPAYLRVDLAASKHWHVRLPGRDASIGMMATLTNVFGRGNVLVYARDPETGERSAILMRPRSPLVVGIDWRF